MPHAKIAEPLVAVSFNEKQVGTRSGLNAALAEISHYRSLAKQRAATALNFIALVSRLMARLMGARFIRYMIGMFRKPISPAEAVEVVKYLDTLNRQANGWSERLFRST